MYTHFTRTIRFRPVKLLQFNRSVKTLTMDWKPVKSVPGNLRTIAHQAKMPVIRGILLALMYAMPIVSFALGCWQVKRLKWKTELIALCENNLAAPVIPELPPQLDPTAIPEFEYRRFKCKGHFDYENEMFLGPRLRNGELGYLVVTPFVRLNGGDPILIERGWIQKSKVVPETRSKGYLSHLAFPQGEIEIEALFRVMPTKSKIQFEHEEGTRLFHVHDVPAMAKQSGSLPIYCQMIYDLHDHPEWRHDETAQHSKPSLLGKLFFSKGRGSDADAEFIAHNTQQDDTLQYQEFEFVDEGVPVAARPYIKFTNNHLQYLITWFGLSAGSTILLIYSIWKSKQFATAERIIAEKRKDMQRKA
ncbi:Cytochrome oxidase assembly protein SHY1 [Candida viswanathii]|uniref:SURF1-like protein n=1 Tax=Candida viswanathii TaxID=5486 RepID=A0A367YGE9_9ASCO|nr:Cytochrome oxidase assembly protein SHY1 [Candida viswanathii]